MNNRTKINFVSRIQQKKRTHNFNKQSDCQLFDSSGPFPYVLIEFIGKNQTNIYDSLTT